MSQQTEVPFPRGGRQKWKGNEKPSSSGDLFKVQIDEDEKPLSKKKKKHSRQRKVEAEGDSVVVIENLTLQTLSSDMILLGCVMEIEDYSVKISLPGCLYGTLPIVSISDRYTQLIKAFSDNPDDFDDEVAVLKTLFSVGQTFPFKVMSTKCSESGKNHITLSVNPRHVNAALRPSSLLHGMVLYSAVQSVEDHGYVMDIGIKDCPAFLSHHSSLEYIRDYNNGRSLMVGQIVPAALNMPDLSEEILCTRQAVTLTAEPRVVRNSKLKESRDIVLNSFIPGTAVDAVVQKVTKQGLIVDCHGFIGCVCKNHLKSASGEQLVYKEGQNVQGTVLYFHPITHVIYLTLHAIPNPKKLDKMFSGLKKYCIIDEAIITAVQRTHICLKVKDKIQGIAMKSELSDQPIQNVSKKFSINDNVQCRVMSLHYLDNMVGVSLKQSVLNQTYLSREDLTVGTVYKGKVKRLVNGGMVVTLSPGVQGFVRDIHMADVPLTKPEAMFPPGKNVKCKVLKIDPSCWPPSVLLTCKKGMLMSRVPILSSYQEASPGLLSKGVIVNIKENGLILSFLNDVQGWVPSSEFGAYKILHPEKVFFKGQVVKCRVINCYPDDKKLFLTLKIDSSKFFGDKDVSDKKFDVGKIVEVRVKKRTEKGLDVIVKGTKFQAFLPLLHLSDHVGNCKNLLETYNEKDVIRVLCFSSKGIPVVTRKASLLVAAENGVFHSQISEFEEQSVIPVVVKHFAKYGMFVELCYNITGLVPNKYIADRKILKPEEAGYVHQQTLMGKIIRIETERNRVELSTKMEDVYDKEYTYGLDLLQSYFDDDSKIREYWSSTNDIKSDLSKLTIGSIVLAKITSIVEIGVLCELHDGFKGFATNFHCDNIKMQENEEYRAVILYVDIADECVELSFRHDLVRNVSKEVKDVDSRMVKIDQIIKSEAVVIKKEFVLVALGGHAVGRFAFVPARRVLNDLIGREDLYSIGQYYHIVIKRVLDGAIFLGVLKQHVHDLQTNDNESITFKRKSEESNNMHTKKQKVPSKVGALESVVFTEVQSKFEQQTEVLESQEEPENCELSVGKKYVATIKKIKEFQMDILIKGRIAGRVHITEAANDLNGGVNPFKKYVPGSQVEVWVIGFHMQKSHSFLVLSHRQVKTYAECSLLKHPPVPLNRTFSLGDEVRCFIKEVNKTDLSVWISPEILGTLPLNHVNVDSKMLQKPHKYYRPGDVLEAQVSNILDEIELTQLNYWEPQPGMNVSGLVHTISADKGISVKLPHGYFGEVHLTDLRDSYIPADRMLFPLLEKGLIQCHVLEVDHNTKSCQLSTRVSRIKPSHKEPLDPELLEKDLKCGLTVRGFIKSITSSALIVTLGRNLESAISVSSIASDVGSDVLKMYSIGSVVKVKVLTSEGNKTTLSIIHEHVGKTDVSVSNSASTKNEKGTDGSASSTKNKRKLTCVEKNGLDLEAQIIVPKPQNAVTKSLPWLQVSGGFNFDVVMPSDLRTPDQNFSDFSDSDGEKQGQTAKKQKKDLDDELTEEHIFERENLLLDKGRQPETADEFEEFIKTSPNVASYWVKYMVFYLEQMEIDKARSVAERALKTISFREEEEKLKVWIAFLNLENLYGTQESMQDVFERALSQNEPIKLYKGVVEIYSNSNKIEEAESLYQTMIKKFNLNKEVWINFGLFYMKTGRPELARKVMDRSLKSVDRKYHVDVIAKFAQMEFKHGEASLGKTMFENILKNYPKRTDLWSVYIDLLIKLGELDEVQKVFEQVITMKMTARKMKFFFKRFLNFEQQYGSEETSNEVKKKASEYFKSDFF